MGNTKGKRPLCSVIDDIGPDREQVSEVIKGKRIENFDYLTQISAEERSSIIEEVLSETLKPFINFDFKPKENDFSIHLTSEWRLKEED